MNAKQRREAMDRAREVITAGGRVFYDALDAENVRGARSALADLRQSLEDIEADLLPIRYRLATSRGAADVECITCTNPCHSVEGRDAPMCDECHAVAEGVTS